MTTRPRVVVLGGGFAGLETAFLLAQRLDGRAELTLVSDREQFLFKPNTIYIPFGSDPDSLLIPLAKPTDRRGIRLFHGFVDGVDAPAARVHLGDRVLPYDYLVIATGANMRAEEIPGLAEHGETIWTVDQMLSLRVRLAELERRVRAGESQTVLFVVPPNNKCSGPLYEIVFMLETWLTRRGIREGVRLVYTTYEQTYIQAFGPKLDEVVREEFAQRGVSGSRQRVAVRVDEHEVAYADGSTDAFDLLIAFPPYVAAMDYDGLTRDDRGFLQTDPSTRAVVAADRIYAAGDAADFPVKQAFLALLQGDVVAERIAAEVRGVPATATFDPVSMCVMEEFDKATFAQVPLVATGDPARPVAVRPSANGDYRVGVSPLWRLGKKLLGLYLPYRFGAGRPFHAGAPWQAMELGLKGMSSVLARR